MRHWEAYPSPWQLSHHVLITYNSSTLVGVRQNWGEPQRHLGMGENILLAYIDDQIGVSYICFPCLMNYNIQYSYPV